MSKDNREECKNPDCKDGYVCEQTQQGDDSCHHTGEGCHEHNQCGEYVAVKCGDCHGTGEVTIDSGADVCEWERADLPDNAMFKDVAFIACNGTNHLGNIMGWKVCPYCTKPITIRGERDENRNRR